MRFSEAMQSVTRHGDGWQGTVGEDWLQGRSAFGGIQAALALRAMRELVSADMPLRSLQTTFVAPVPQVRSPFTREFCARGAAPRRLKPALRTASRRCAN